MGFAGLISGYDQAMVEISDPALRFDFVYHSYPGAQSGPVVCLLDIEGHQEGHFDPAMGG